MPAAAGKQQVRQVHPALPQLLQATLRLVVAPAWSAGVVVSWRAVEPQAWRGAASCQQNAGCEAPKALRAQRRHANGQFVAISRLSGDARAGERPQQPPHLRPCRIAIASTAAGASANHPYAPTARERAPPASCWRATSRWCGHIPQSFEKNIFMSQSSTSAARQCGGVFGRGVSWDAYTWGVRIPKASAQEQQPCKPQRHQQPQQVEAASARRRTCLTRCAVGHRAALRSGQQHGLPRHAHLALADHAIACRVHATLRPARWSGRAQRGALCRHLLRA